MPRESYRLSPEYKNAANTIDEILCLPDIVFWDKIPQNFDFTAGSFLAIKNDFKSKQIPSEKTWRWNQVKARKNAILINSQYYTEFYKLMPRPIYKNSTMLLSGPKKLWRFNILSKDDPKPLFIILWCEKGEKEKELCIDDFKFLSPFLEPGVAQSLWPQMCSVV